MSKNTKDKLNKSHAKVDLVRNPFLFPISDEIKQKIDSGEIDESIFIYRNQHEMHNSEVSFANEYYQPVNEIKESATIRYIKIDSGVIPKEYIGRVDSDTEIPYDYYLITRSDNTQFLISEIVSNKTQDPSLEDLNKYSVLRYTGKKEKFKEDIIYSEGLDLARLLTRDQEYIDVFADRLLSEQRLNESLMTGAQSKDAQQKDETDHADHYVGYIIPRSLLIGSSYNELMGEIINKELESPETGLVKYSNKPIDRLFRMIQKANDLWKSFKNEVTGSTSAVKTKDIPASLSEDMFKDPVINVESKEEEVISKEEKKNTLEVPVEVLVGKKDEKGKVSISITEVRNALDKRRNQQMTLEMLSKHQYRKTRDDDNDINEPKI